ncbi:MAG: NAD(P)-dependent oxidoreductase [Chloroflexi bacterium]|nr:NAD(P)-dependent oxidoreductase [Chloroflexota bacterium]MCY3696096.1 NAD(P)-dependent oxidoreductase [Chloroflexota bacterium]MXX80287.1 NAD(P)-dependent oxidoreductase [Chloroflexota bacterium]MYF21570.1 NAD(P)-dependent oxidoreductase [Chloroflexota bacterium]
MEREAAMERIGFIGLGIMGVPMVANLIEAGYAPTVWNRSRPGIDACVELGATAADSPRAAAEASDILITIVTDSPDVEDVLVGRDDAAIHGLVEGSVVIDMSTISPAVTRDLAARLSERGVAMLDAPVSGGDSGAKAGTLSIMVGGDADALERCSPVLEAMGSTITHCGPTGAGQTVKLCNQVAIAGALLGVCEALSLADKSGVDQERMLAAISAGAAGSWQLSNLGPKIAVGDYAPGFMVRLMQKDLRLALEAGGDVMQPMPNTSFVHQLYYQLQASGLGDEGTQALARVVSGLGDSIFE